MRGWTWTLLGLLGMGLVGCGGGEEETPIPDDVDVTTEMPEIDEGTLIDDAVTPADDSSSPAIDRNSEAPVFDPGSEAPAFDSGSGDDSSEDASDADSGEAPPADDSSTEPSTGETTSTDLDELATADLIALLANPDARDGAVDAIRDRGDAAVPHLMAALDDDDWQVRAGAVFALSMLGRQASEAIPRLEALAANESHEGVRDAVAWAIEAIDQAP